MSEQIDETRPGYAEIKLASTLHPESGAWAFFMREVMRLPAEMTPAVIQMIRLENWKLAPNPLEAIRSDAFEAHLRAWTKSATRSSITTPVSRKAR